MPLASKPFRAMPPSPRPRPSWPRRGDAGIPLRRTCAAAIPDLPLEEQKRIVEPPALEGDAEGWITAIIQHNHEVGLAPGRFASRGSASNRADSDRLPDPTFGLHLASERDGEENIIGAYVIINLPGGARRAKADAALAEAEAANHARWRLQKVTAEAASLYQTARADAFPGRPPSQAATRSPTAEYITARAYQRRGQHDRSPRGPPHRQ